MWSSVMRCTGCIVLPGRGQREVVDSAGVRLAQGFVQGSRRCVRALSGTHEVGVSSFVDFFGQGSNMTKAAHLVMKPHLCVGATVVDATAGNGHDTLFLAQHVGPAGVVHAFDVQASALTATDQRLQRLLKEQERPQVHLHNCSHANMLTAVGSDCASVVCFNLGYLPGGDKALITRTDETLEAMQQATAVLKGGGLLSVMGYTGHEGGDEEVAAVREFMRNLDKYTWSSMEMALMNRPTAPVLMVAHKMHAAS